ncbi:MAG: tRNA dihydrouridine(20/20a) synthase DusA [Steroidobacteraceae bacterium]|nr:tRNA dihydrouridine(20/20a) synthase DusA [Steroidobacteraceae bacterium]
MTESLPATPASPDRRLSVAPMMAWTDRHCRYFLRQFSPRTLLYTEMVVANAILRGDRNYLLGFDPAERPLALQLGGSDPAMLAEAAAIGEQFGYDEVNLNVGCPSDRVQNATFGACLMARPRLVADCVRAMRAAVRVPVTVKTRIGIDDRDDYPFLQAFIEEVAAAGCEVFVIHARKAILSGLSPKENREIPPLVYERAWRVKRDYPQLTVVVNGGLRTVPQVAEQWRHADGVMLGREAYHNPYVLSALHAVAWEDHFHAPTPAQVVGRMQDYAARQLAAGTPLRAITRHMLGMMNGRAGARSWRRVLSEGVSRGAATPALLADALRAAEEVAVIPPDRTDPDDRHRIPLSRSGDEHHT